MNEVKSTSARGRRRALEGGELPGPEHRGRRTTPRTARTSKGFSGGRGSRGSRLRPAPVAQPAQGDDPGLPELAAVEPHRVRAEAGQEPLDVKVPPDHTGPLALGRRRPGRRHLQPDLAAQRIDPERQQPVAALEPGGRLGHRREAAILRSFGLGEQTRRAQDGGEERRCEASGESVPGSRHGFLSGGRSAAEHTTGASPDREAHLLRYNGSGMPPVLRSGPYRVYF
jgi:hypothetical protein